MLDMTDSFLTLLCSSIIFMKFNVSCDLVIDAVFLQCVLFFYLLQCWLESRELPTLASMSRWAIIFLSVLKDSFVGYSNLGGSVFTFRASTTWVLTLLNFRGFV